MFDSWKPASMSQSVSLVGPAVHLMVVSCIVTILVGSGAPQASAQELIFIDRFESGDMSAWSPYTPTPGGSCGGGVPLLVPQMLPFTYFGKTNCGMSNTYESTCLDSFDTGEDAIHELNVITESYVMITIDPHDSGWTAIALDELCPIATGECLDTSTASTGVHSTGCIPLEAGTYYVMVDTWSPPDCIPDYALSVQPCTP